MSIFAYFFQIVILINYVSGKIKRHVPPQSTAAKNGGHVPPRLPGAPMIKPPTPISKANFAYGHGAGCPLSQGAASTATRPNITDKI